MSDDVKKTEISKEVISPVKPGAKLADESETKPSTNPFATPTVKPGAAGTSAPGALSTKPMKFKKKTGEGEKEETASHYHSHSGGIGASAACIYAAKSVWGGTKRC